MDDPLVLAGVSLTSRLLVGTAYYPSPNTCVEAIAASGAEVITLSMQWQQTGIVDLLRGYRYLPNTAGCFTARKIQSKWRGQCGALLRRDGSANSRAGWRADEDVGHPRRGHSGRDQSSLLPQN